MWKHKPSSLTWSTPSVRVENENLKAAINISGFCLHIDFSTRDDKPHLTSFSLMAVFSASPLSFPQFSHLNMSLYVHILPSSPLNQSIMVPPPPLILFILLSLRLVNHGHLYSFHGSVLLFSSPNVVDVRSELYVDIFFRKLLFNAPAHVRQQRFIVILLYPSVRRRLRSLKRKYFASFCHVLIVNFWLLYFEVVMVPNRIQILLS